MIDISPVNTIKNSTKIDDNSSVITSLISNVNVANTAIKTNLKQQKIPEIPEGLDETKELPNINQEKISNKFEIPINKELKNIKNFLKLYEFNIPCSIYFWHKEQIQKLPENIRHKYSINMYNEYQDYLKIQDNMWDKALEKFNKVPISYEFTLKEDLKKTIKLNDFLYFNNSGLIIKPNQINILRILKINTNIHKLHNFGILQEILITGEIKQVNNTMLNIYTQSNIYENKILLDINKDLEICNICPFKLVCEIIN